MLISLRRVHAAAASGSDISWIELKLPKPAFSAASSVNAFAASLQIFDWKLAVLDLCYSITGALPLELSKYNR